LIAHLLDVRLAQLAKQNLLTYSRYADDLTFSTSQKAFPASIAKPKESGGPEWALGDDLVFTIKGAGFAINPAKTRMQFRMSRQLVTGLMVNAKVNIRPEYYRSARAMCHSLFETSRYYRPAITSSVEGATPEGSPSPALISFLGPIEGILSHTTSKTRLTDAMTAKRRRALRRPERCMSASSHIVISSGWSAR
jgi:RNA-directed DNA polymerase